MMGFLRHPRECPHKLSDVKVLETVLCVSYRVSTYTVIYTSTRLKLRGPFVLGK